jgi:hypothetical protein
MELIAVQDGPDPDQRLYPGHIEIVNNGNAISGSLHVQLNEEHEVVISHLGQGKSIELELTIENE